MTRLVFALLLYSCSVHAQSDPHFCKQSNTECKNINDCSPIMEQVQKRKLSFAHLRRITCQVTANYPKVCCPVSNTQPIVSLENKQKQVPALNSRPIFSKRPVWGGGSVTNPRRTTPRLATTTRTTPSRFTGRPLWGGGSVTSPTKKTFIQTPRATNRPPATISLRPEPLTEKITTTKQHPARQQPTTEQPIDHQISREHATVSVIEKAINPDIRKAGNSSGTGSDKDFGSTLQEREDEDVLVSNNTINLDGMFPSDCGISTAIFKVFGGRTSEPGAWPWLAALQYNDTIRPRFACGGVLIHKHFVLTAAHCVIGKKGPLKLFKIRIGDHNLLSDEDKTDPQDFSPLVVVPHEKYSAGSQHYDDIALIKLDRDIVESYFVSPICLPTMEQPLTEDILRDTSVTVAGWGSDGERARHDALQQVDINIVPKQNCQIWYNKFKYKLTTTQLCAGSLGKDSCSGDSGGPLMYPDLVSGQYRVAGIVSLGSVKCGRGVPGIYTVVSDYIPWIVNTIKQIDSK